MDSLKAGVLLLIYTCLPVLLIKRMTYLCKESLLNVSQIELLPSLKTFFFFFFANLFLKFPNYTSRSIAFYFFFYSLYTLYLQVRFLKRLQSKTNWRYWPRQMSQGTNKQCEGRMGYPYKQAEIQKMMSKHSHISIHFPEVSSVPFVCSNPKSHYPA